MNPFPLRLALLQTDPFVRHALPGGAELLVLEAPGAPGESILVALPHGLLDDRPGTAQRKQLAGNPMATWIEGQYALNLLALELRIGLDVPRLRAELGGKAGQRAVALAGTLAHPARRGSLRLSGKH